MDATQVIIAIIGVVTTILAGIGAGLAIIWKYFTSQAEKDRIIILEQAQRERENAERERENAAQERLRTEDQREKAQIERSKFLKTVDNMAKLHHDDMMQVVQSMNTIANNMKEKS